MPITCPYCNAPVLVPQPPPTNGRVSCPRCEEIVTIPGGDSAPSPAMPVSSPAETPRIANRAIAGLVLAAMLGMAALGLAFALRTVGFRRANDSKGAVPPEVVAEPMSRPPVAWPGIGYLPDNVQAVAGVRVADVMNSPAGRALLASLGFADAKKATILAISPSSVDYLMLGATLRALPPRVTAIVHGSIGGLPKTDRTTEKHGKTLHRVKLWPTGPEGAIWQADRHTLVATLLPEDFDKVPAQPRTTPPLADLMERLDPTALAWFVTSVEPNSAAGLFAAQFLPTADRDAWTKLEALALSLRAEGPKLTLTVQLHAQDAAAGAAMATALAESLTKAGITVERREGSGERPEDWQTLTATTDAEKLTVWLAGLGGR